MGHHSCCSKQKVRRGLWSPEEDEKLINYISTYGHGCWSSVPRLAGLQRCGKSCRLRWINYLRPDLKRGSFSPQEESLIIELHRMLGNRWAQIAKNLPGRTDNEVKNYWNSSIKKKFISQGTNFAEKTILNSSKPDPLFINVDFNQMVSSSHDVYIPGATTPPDFACEELKTDIIGYNPESYAAAATATPRLPFPLESFPFDYSTWAFQQQHHSDDQLESPRFDVSDGNFRTPCDSLVGSTMPRALHEIIDMDEISVPSSSSSQEVASSLQLPFFSERTYQFDPHIPMSHMEAIDVVLGSYRSSTLSCETGSMNTGLATYWET